jgi:hypothetical protein
MATPSRIIYEDPTRGLDLVSTRDPGLEKTRYLFTAGQFLDPDRVFQLDYLRDAGGGEEVEANCLRRTQKGFIPRAHLTPLEVWSQALPAELLPEGAETVVISSNQPTAPRGGISSRPSFLLGKPLQRIKFYPGDEIGSITRANTGKGIVEVIELFGQGWYEDEQKGTPGIPQVLNLDFFPVVAPPELRKLRERIEKVSERSDLHQNVAKDMLTSCAQFERWAQARLAAEHVLLRQRVSHQHTYTYSPIAYELLRQLEMKPQDQIIEGMSGGINTEQLAEIIKASGGQSGLTPEQFTQIVSSVTQSLLAAQSAQATQGPSSVGAYTTSDAIEAGSASVEAPKNKGGRPRKDHENVGDVSGSKG